MDLAASALDETIRMEGAETVAAFIWEPITSGGGVLVQEENYLKEVRKGCDEHGVLLILDEVVSGLAAPARCSATTTTASSRTS